MTSAPTIAAIKKIEVNAGKSTAAEILDAENKVRGTTESSFIDNQITGSVAERLVAALQEKEAEILAAFKASQEKAEKEAEELRLSLREFAKPGQMYSSESIDKLEVMIKRAKTTKNAISDVDCANTGFNLERSAKADPEVAAKIENSEECEILHQHGKDIKCCIEDKTAIIQGTKAGEHGLSKETTKKIQEIMKNNSGKFDAETAQKIFNLLTPEEQTQIIKEAKDKKFEVSSDKLSELVKNNDFVKFFSEQLHESPELAACFENIKTQYLQSSEKAQSNPENNTERSA